MSIKRLSRISLPLAISLTALVLSLMTVAALADGLVIDTQVPNAAISTVFGETANAKTGHAIATGDINGDGYEDLIVGAPYADVVPSLVYTNCTSQSYNEYVDCVSGGVYLYLGRPQISNTLDLLNQPANVTFYARPSTWSGEELGRSVAAGDLNGDGLDDIIMGASHYGNSPIGAAFVWVGRPSITTNSAISLDIKAEHGSGFNLKAVSAWKSDYGGWDVATGDVNGDGIGDLILGSYRASVKPVTSPYPPDFQVYHNSAPITRTQNGIVYVELGRSGLTTTSGTYDDYMICLPELTIYGENSYDYLGRSLASGDLDNDGFDDIIIGAPGNPGQVATHTGNIYVFYGSNTIARTNCDVHSDPPIAENQIVKELAYITTTADITLTGITPGDRSGFDVSTGDLNGDNYDDIVVGAPYANGNQGQVYVVYGGPRPGMLATTIPLSQADLTISGAAPNTWLGSSVFAGDVNADGTDDLLMGAIGIDPNNADYSGTSNTTDKGTAYVLFGGSLSGTLDLSSYSPNLTILGASADDWLGRGLGVGDLNADGFNELLIGAAGLDYTSRTDTGAAYLINLAYPNQITVTGSLTQVATAHTVSFYTTGKTRFGIQDVTTQTIFTISPGAGGTWDGNRYTSALAGTWTVTGTLGSLSDATSLTVLSSGVSKVYLPIILR
jgi:hypothetical protein